MAMSSATISDHVKRDLKSIFLKSVEAVRPANLIDANVRIEEANLLVQNHAYPLSKPCYVVGFGKAIAEMAITLESILGNYLHRGVVTVPLGTFLHSPRPVGSRISFIEGARDNYPDKAAETGAIEIKKLAEGLDADDLLIVLISGGGSALLPLPKRPVTLEEKLELTKKLSLGGSDITELNVVRKNLSVLKGGGLAQLAYPARVVGLILSDVIEDDLEAIASGPTVPNTSNPKEVMEIIKKYSLYDDLPDSIGKVLRLERQVDVEVSWSHVNNFVIGNNKIATRAALEQASELGYQSCVLSTTVKGDVGKISKIYAELACQLTLLIKPDNGDKAGKEKLKNFLVNLQELGVSRDSAETVAEFDFSKKLCLIFGGEPTVVVSGSGRGGRNQQLALQFSVEISQANGKRADISFLSCGTDGIDGPTDAAGALGSCNLVDNALRQKMNPVQFLANCDSYGFYAAFDSGDNLVRTGHTGTNVMDVHVLIITPNLD